MALPDAWIVTEEPPSETLREARGDLSQGELHFASRFPSWFVLAGPMNKELECAVPFV